MHALSDLYALVPPVQLKVQSYPPGDANVLSQLKHCSLSSRESVLQTASIQPSVEPFAPPTAHSLGLWTDHSIVFTKLCQSAPLFNKWPKQFDIRPHHRRRRTVQSYSPRGANVLSSHHAPSHEGTLAPPGESICVTTKILC